MGSPSSIILTSEDYGRLLGSESAQAIQHAFGASKSSIYVGVGGGLSDPNFSRFLDWQRDKFPNPGLRDYRLCTDSELSELQAAHIADNIIPISYGQSHTDLAAFVGEIQAHLSDMARSDVGLLFDPVGEVRAEFAAALREDVILGQSLEVDRGLALDEVLLPPILLPVPNAQYVASKTSGQEVESIERLEMSADLQTNEIILLVGEEGSGLTFTARLMSLRASQMLPLLAPVYFNFTESRIELRPILNGLRRAVREVGWPLGKNDDLPPLAIAIDDFSPYVQKVSDRGVADIAKLRGSFVVVACKQGTEEDVKRKLAAAGISVRVRYVGKLERSDIEHLAKIAAPGQFAALANAVIDLLRSEHLPRTPFTVSQLLYILMSAGSIGSNASTTSVLDEYVALLLGRGDPHDDARIGLDHEQRMAILERLAEKFVELDKAGMAESTAVAAVEQIIETLGWPESAMDVLQNFLDRRVLTKRSGYVVFARSSYLHLFAAKQAKKSITFRDRLLARPLYYVSAITDYASLNRHDDVLLDRIEQLLGELKWSEERSEVFAEIEPSEPSFEEIEESAGEDGSQLSQGTQVEPPSASDSLDVFSDDDPPPFPVSNEEDEPRLWKQIQTVDLCSRILRDADQAGDVDRKKSILGTLMHQWGDIITELDADESFQELFAGIAEGLRAQFGDDTQVGQAERDFLDDLHKILPAAIAFGGITETLASRKLLKSMSRLVDSGEAAVEPETAVASIFFLIAVSESGWATQVKKILKNQTNTWIIRNFVFSLLLSAYFGSDASNADDVPILEALVEVLAHSHKYADEPEKARHSRLIRSNMQAFRATQRNKERSQAAIANRSD